MRHSNSTEYYRSRERAERQAAETATSAEARRVHEKLAMAYALLVRPESAASA